MQKKVITRFAPSPTGFLHIGGARTALFNWIFAKATGGDFLLRIEDTDRARSTEIAVQAIINGLKWLGLDWDGEIVMQFARSARHIEVAEQLLDLGLAYRCYLSAEDLEKIKQQNPYEKILSPWRDGTKQPVIGVKPTIRLKVNLDEETTIHDRVRGIVTVTNKELDDMILLRSDKTPTYMLAVVVDDHDMGITHVIRGDDHFTNTFRQYQIIKALSWDVPIYSHIPLIHGQDGAKLSKRHGALGIDYYRDSGYLPEAICNYLMRLGWSNGNDEIFTKEEAAKIFTLEALNHSPARFDLQKLNSINAHYISQKSDEALMKLINLTALMNHSKELQDQDASFNDIVQKDDYENNEEFKENEKKILLAMPELKKRAKTIAELQELAGLYLYRNDLPDEKSEKILHEMTLPLLKTIKNTLDSCNDWSSLKIKECMDDFAINNNISSGKIMQILRAVVIGSFQSPPIYDTLAIIGKKDVLKRLSCLQSKFQ